MAQVKIGTKYKFKKIIFKSCGKPYRSQMIAVKVARGL